MRDLLQVASTRNGTSGRNTSPQGTLRARFLSSFKCSARNEATTASTRPAPRSQRLARQASGQPPLMVTPPGTARGELKPLERTSAHSASSRPGVATRKISNRPSLLIAMEYREAASTFKLSIEEGRSALKLEPACGRGR